MESKQEIRQATRTLRRGLSGQQVLEKSACIQNRVLSDPVFLAAGRVLIYRAMPDEVQTLDLILATLEMGKKVFVPLVIPKDPELAVVGWPESETAWEPGPFGIAQPRKEGVELVSAGTLDLVLAPGLAFDLAGGRLGFGKGYFDRLFKRTSSQCHRFGLAFDLQVIEKVPMGPQDIALHRIVTESRTITAPCKPGSFESIYLRS